ncbi:MAG: hypothetical protein EOM53_01990 [Alphaproteobacteria bacterium]|nr:hypothetical protein [Alphaproteobacteria bacterium]
MSKFFMFIFSIFIAFSLYLAKINKDITNERCPTFEEVRKNPELMEKLGCACSGGSGFLFNMSMWPTINFANKIKKVYADKNKNALFDLVEEYPIYAKGNEIHNKQELIDYFSKIEFRKSIIKSVQSERLFWRHVDEYMLGHGAIWFTKTKNGFKIIAINSL